ncbi:amino acid acetyltransferase [Leptospira tipperaryensis]|uniref:Amino acid acetyltransferase n=1 Tax=Leptospira tipperaryensis TaxID=2564040 RepID=A0A1D7UUQ4_9LEPT|nr:GNAT family protein [Leptospira tipperaryensis]AOP33340.1 amino acid acetyltransferase [Leptospira tipperaryensis]
MKYSYPPEPTILVGEHVELHPLRMEHHDSLIEAVKDGELWKLWYTHVPAPEGMKAWIEKAILEEKEKLSLPFVVKRKSDQKILGSTRFMNIETFANRMEIGTTWYRKEAQKTAVNTECKLLLLEHAFEKLDCIAVEFRTHRLNDASRKAIARLGAVQDGIIRNHRIMPNGTMRDTVIFSIIAGEWPTVKSHLQFKLGRI